MHSQRAGTNMRGGLAALVAVTALAACSSNPSLQGTPVGSAAPAPAPGESPLEAYRHYWDLQSSIAAHPGARDWASDITLVTVDPLRTADIAEWQKYRDLGVVRTGTIGVSPQIISQTGTQATVKDCVDVSAVQSTQNGRLLPHAPGFPDRFQTDAILRVADGAWRLASLDQHYKSPC
jgi:hypothetical protein